MALGRTPFEDHDAPALFSALRESLPARVALPDLQWRRPVASLGSRRWTRPRVINKSHCILCLFRQVSNRSGGHLGERKALKSIVKINMVREFWSLLKYLLYLSLEHD